MAIKVGKILGRVAKAAAANPALTVAIVAGVAPGLAAKLARLAPLLGSATTFSVRADAAHDANDGDHKQT